MRRTDLVATLLQLVAPSELCPTPVIHKETFALGGQKLVQIAFRTHLAPLLHTSLIRRGLSDRLDQTNAEALEAAFLLNTDRNRVVMGQMDRIRDALEAEGAVPVFLKGTALLAANVYPDFGSRQLFDIDVLVAPEFLEPCAQVFLSQGYEVAVSDYVAEKYEKSIGARSQHYPVMRAKEEPALLELHDAFEAYNSFDGVRADQILDAAKTGEMGLKHGSPQQMLRMAVLHSLRRGFSEKLRTLNLKDIVDILYLVQKYPELTVPLRCDQPLMMQIAQVNDHYFEDLLGVGRLLGTRAGPRSRRRWKLHRWAMDHPVGHARVNGVLETINPARLAARIRTFVMSSDYRAYLATKFRSRSGKTR